MLVYLSNWKSYDTFGKVKLVSPQWIVFSVLGRSLVSCLPNVSLENMQSWQSDTKNSLWGVGKPISGGEEKNL